ncbi:hypothetical protein HW555_001603 [Spodoptera exigua]|uniref:Very-long-chain 3-oxoacyl-CoA synthase n=1 Tax=Spodoptera exigua TaxID=7107 RepID=A0A835LA95_SPOEX|nr:hypothetical protein HW555_001603 [Spodoptera exigua]
MAKVQFLSILVHFVMWYMRSECTTSLLSCFIVVFNASLFIVLFGKFYKESYTNKEKRRMAKDT